MSRLSARPVPTPLRAVAPDAEDGYLDQVDARLKRAVQDLAVSWSEAMQGDREVPVLGRFDLPDLLHQTLSAGGKRIRPVMARLGWRAAGGQPETAGAEQVVVVGAALDLLHAFALIHDDVMDASARRRGEPTIHVLAASLHEAAGGSGDDRRFGENIAILLGDLALAEAAHLVSELPGPLRRRWQAMIVELVCGQRADLTGSAVPRYDVATAEQIARLKSGCYTVLRPLELGAAAADASPAALALLSRYGEELGAAFALRDDLLGIWGDPQLTGKPAGDDLISGKPTMIMALAADRLSGPARDLVRRTGGRGIGADDVARFQEELRRAGVPDEVERRIEQHVAAAVDALDPAALEPAAVHDLVRMAHRVAWRDR